MTGLHGTGDFEGFYWTTGPTTSRGRYCEGQVTVVPTGDGLRPTRMTEELYLPYSAKAMKGCFFVFLRTSFVG